MPLYRRQFPVGPVHLAVLLWFGITPLSSESAPWPHGELIDVGGHMLYIQCQGDGLPVVVLDSGLGGASSDWRDVQPKLAMSNRTCIYDRAGYGRSDSGPLPRTSGRIAAELRTLLLRAGLPPPYLLVGHSFGGFNARMFAGLFPQETAGVVLVDSPHEDQAEALLEHGILGLMDPTGWLGTVSSADLLSSLPAELAGIAELFGPQTKTWYVILNEAAAFDASRRELQATPMPSDIPLGVLMHGRRIFPGGPLGEGLEREWLHANRELARAQERSLFAIAPQSGHLIHAEQPELIVEMVRKVLQMGSGPG
jgi:pimeloyl-ACP methyl ester carboxylesterase